MGKSRTARIDRLNTRLEQLGSGPASFKLTDSLAYAALRSIVENLDTALAARDTQLRGILKGVADLMDDEV